MDLEELMKEFEYQDLLLALWTDPTPGFYSAVGRDEFGRSTPRAQLRMPFDDPRFVGYVDQLGELNPEELQYVGARLFDSLFQGDLLRLYIHLREQIRPTETRLRIRLKIDPPNVARLPWECLYDTRSAVFLGSSPDTTLVRFLEQEKEPPSLPLEPPLRVLVAAEYAEGAHASKVKAEVGAVREALRRLEAEGVLTVREAGRGLGQDCLTRDELGSLVRRDADVLHLITSSLWTSGEAKIGLARSGGGGDYVTPGELVGLLKGGSPRLLVLSGGESVIGAGPELAGQLLAHIPALLSLAGLRPEDLAVRFTESFYRALSGLKPVDAALSEARGELGSLFPVESSWLAPALFLSQKDAALFHSRAGERVRQVYQLSEGRYRRRLRETLNRIWPKPERYSRQLLRWMPRQEPLSAYLHALDFLAQPQDAPELARRFQRLLLLGEAGAGKSMTLFKLFYDSAQPILSYSAKSPLPIYASLSDMPEGGDLLEYLSDGFDRKLFLSDLEEGRFLFLLDGLDEMSADSATRLTGELNTLMRRFSLNRYVTAARRPGPAPIEIPNWFEILPFAEWEATDFLAEGEAMRVEQARVVYRQLVRNIGPRGGNPQILAMARRLWREGASIPYTMSGLFEAFYKVAGESVSAELRGKLLPELAVLMSQAGRTSIRREHLETGASWGESERWLSSPGLTGMSPDELLAALSKTRLLRGPHAFSFPNLAIQEFLTAYALQSRNTHEILELIAPAEWTLIPSVDERPHNLRRGAFHGALPFLSGMLEDSSALIEGLLDRDLVLASECCREARYADRATARLQSEIQRALASTGEIQQQIGCLSLEALGDAWAVKLLEGAASDGEFPSRALALSALGSLRSYGSVPLLQSAAKEKDPDVARAAQDALARIKAS